MSVAAGQRQIFADGLRDEQPVEWVAVVQGQCSERGKMLIGDVCRRKP